MFQLSDVSQDFRVSRTGCEMWNHAGGDVVVHPTFGHVTGCWQRSIIPFKMASLSTECYDVCITDKLLFWGEQWVRRKINQLVPDVSIITNLSLDNTRVIKRGNTMRDGIKPFCARITRGWRANCLAKGCMGEWGMVLWFECRLRVLQSSILHILSCYCSFFSYLLPSYLLFIITFLWQVLYLFSSLLLWIQHFLIAFISFDLKCQRCNYFSKFL